MLSSLQTDAQVSFQKNNPTRLGSEDCHTAPYSIRFQLDSEHQDATGVSEAPGVTADEAQENVRCNTSDLDRARLPS